MNYPGGCHCGAVKFEVDAPEQMECHACNCSICLKTGYLHLIVAKSRFRLLCGDDALVSYQWNTGKAKHLFCKVCGVKSFYIPRSNPNGYSVNVRCLEPYPDNLVIIPFDGQNWEIAAPAISLLSDD